MDDSTRSGSTGISALPEGSRRELIATLLGVAAGAAAVQALAGCVVEDPDQVDPETGEVVQGLSGTTNIYWVDTVASLRALSGSANYVAILQGYSTVADGGGGLFVWSTSAATDDGGTVLNSGGLDSSSAGWRRIFEGPLNVKWFGAKGDQATDDSAAIQRAINACGKGSTQWTGGTVYFPKGNYLVSSTLKIGDAPNGPPDTNWREGICLRGASRSMATWSTVLIWNGATQGGPILKVRNASAGAIEDIAFEGNGKASPCLQFTHVTGDTLITSGWRLSGVFVRGAYTAAGGAISANVLIGEPEGSTSDGDCSAITFENCYFGGTGANAHVRQRAANTFGTAFYNCRFSASLVNGTYYPSYGISLQAGTASVFGGSFDPVGVAALHLDGRSGIPAPAICAYSVEVQSGSEVLFTQLAQSGAGASQRASVLSGVFHSDIVTPTSSRSIYWDIDWFGALVLEGCRFQGDVEIGNANAKVFSHGTVFDSGKGFTGTGATRIYGDFVDGNSIAGTYHTRIPNLPTYADNAAASAGGIPIGGVYRTSTGQVMVRY